MILQISTEELFSAAVGQAPDAKTQLMNHLDGFLQVVTTLFKPDHTLVSSKTFTPVLSKL